MSVNSPNQRFLFYILLIISLVKTVVGEFDRKYDIENSEKYSHLDVTTCKLDPKLIEEIKSYQGSADKILNEITKGSFKGKSFDDMADFVDEIGPRMSGSKALENGINYIKKLLQEMKLINIDEIPATVPKWIKGVEHAELLKPKQKKLHILALGTSVGTPKDGIQAEAIVVNSMEDLLENKGKAKGKIVIFNYNKKYYDEMSAIVRNAASNASSHGAVAALVRSVTRLSINSPHTKLQRYVPGVKPIPVAALSLDDIDYLAREYKRGKKLVIRLSIEIKANTKDAVSRTLIGDWKGKSKPDEIVIVSGHTDSWNVGQGAQDDGVGIFLALETTRLLQHLDLHPKRTLRNAFWTSEETSDQGITVYFNKYRNEIEKHNVVMEADDGCFKPMGFYFAKLPEVGCILNEIAKLVPITNSTEFVLAPAIPSDLDLFVQNSTVPAVDFIGNDGRYFWYHHTEGDTMTAIDTDDLDYCLVVYATTAYVLADMEPRLPR